MTKERQSWQPLNDADRAMLDTLPDGVVRDGLLGVEVEWYVAEFRDFRKAVLGGELFGVHHSWVAVADNEDEVLVCEDESLADADDLNAARLSFMTDQKFPGHFFVIDDAFIVRAWNILVLRRGYHQVDGYDDWKDEALQIVHYGCLNQG